MKKCLERLYNGVIKENPTFILMLGMCPTLAVTTSAINGLGMGLSTMVVLALSNLLISLLRKVIPDKVRIPAYIVIIATFVTVVELLMHAYLPGLYSSLGIYISLIVVNCIILGRAESYASKNSVIPSLFDGIGMGLGFTVALTMIGLVREFLGGGTLFGVATATMLGGNSIGTILAGFVPKGGKGLVKTLLSYVSLEFTSFSPIGIFVMAPGAFFVLAALTAIQNFIKDQGAKKGKDTSKIQSGCNSDCMNCGDSGCSRRFVEPEKEVIKAPVTEEVKVEEKVTEEVVETAEETVAETVEVVATEEEAKNE